MITMEATSVNRRSTRPAVLVYCPNEEDLEKLLTELKETVKEAVVLPTTPDDVETSGHQMSAVFVLPLTEETISLASTHGRRIRMVMWNDCDAGPGQQARLFLAGVRDIVSPDYKSISAAVACQVRCLQDERTEKDQLSELGRRNGLIGESAAWTDVLRSILTISISRLPVLLYGKSGTGKELVARAIHRENRLFGHGPFQAINCATMTGDIVRSELFGHVKGAFTGAYSDRVGLFRAAQQGTIFLDEIQALDSGTQAMLLRTIQEKKVLPVGSNQEQDIGDVRIITATNQDMEVLVEEGEFREDLYYRLNVLQLRLPLLQERNGDIALLANHFLQKHGRLCNSAVQSISAEVLEAFKLLPWQGNARQLENVLTSALVSKRQGEILHLKDLPAGVWRELAGPMSFSGQVGTEVPKVFQLDRILPYSESIDALERWLFPRALTMFSGNQTNAASFLGITRGKVRDRIARFAIKINHQVEGGQE